MPKKRSSILEILENLKVEIFAEENFSEFCFTIHDSTHINLFQKNLKICFTYKKTYDLSRKHTKYGHDLQKFIPPKNSIFRVLDDNRKLRKNSSAKNFFSSSIINTYFRCYHYIFHPNCMFFWRKSIFFYSFPDVACFFIYFFLCCDGVLWWSWLTGMLSAYLMRILICFCPYVYFILPVLFFENHECIQKS